MFKQVKFIVGADLTSLEEQLNDYLCDLDIDTEITYDFDKNIAVVEKKSLLEQATCIECRHWYDNGDRYALLGECAKCLKRKRYNDKSCGNFERSMK